MASEKPPELLFLNMERFFEVKLALIKSAHPSPLMSVAMTGLGPELALTVALEPTPPIVLLVKIVSVKFPRNSGQGRKSFVVVSFS